MNKLNPDNVMLVVKHNNVEVGRIAATAPNANEYLTGMAAFYGEVLTVDYVEDATAAMVYRVIQGAF